MTTRKTKNNRIRIGALVLAMLLSFSLFAGCGNSRRRWEKAYHQPKCQLF